MKNLMSLVLTFIFISAVSANNPHPPSIFTALSHDEIVEVTISTDIDQLEANIKTEEYQPATFSFLDKDGISVTADVEIRPRGKFRRKACSFPPIKMKFSKDQLSENGYTPFKSVKLVTHCLPEKGVAKENVMREYLTYKMYNELSGKSYRVQLVRINYINSNKPKDQMRRYGFIIESTKEMATRMAAEECECLNSAPETVSAKDENLMAVFQYMIGNEDWSLIKLRNTKLIKPVDGSPMIPVPYDFDFAGMVDAPYAIPNVDYGLKSVKDRKFLGWTADPRQVKVTISLLKMKRKNLEKLIDDFTPLSRYGRSQMLDYLADFYDNIDQLTLETSGQSVASKK